MTEEFKEINPVLLELLAGLGIYGAMLTFSGIILGVLGIKIAAYLQPLIHRRVSERRSGRNEEVESKMN